MDFKTYYSTITNEDLIAILENKDQYQPEAYTAAEQEFANRQLSDDAITSAKRLINDKKAQKAIKIERAQHFENKVQSAREVLLDSLNPLQTGIPSAERSIRAIAIALTGFFIFDVVTNYHSILLWIKDIPGFPGASASVLLPRLLLLTGVVAFGKKRKLGWFLVFVIALIYVLTGILYLMNLFDPFAAHTTRLSDLMPGVSTNTLILETLFFAAIAYTITRPNIRAIYAITRKSMEKLVIPDSALVCFILNIFYASFQSRKTS